MSKNKSTGALRVIRILYAIDTLLLMPCAVIEVAKLLKLEVNFWTRGYLGFLLPAVFLRIFFIPYIATPVLTVLYGYFLRKAKGLYARIYSLCTYAYNMHIGTSLIGVGIQCGNGYIKG